ncbi:MAG TPA: phosphoribosylformylglycinamidine cyclo-ligase [Candidatus Fimadaptatus faecigallinarum]|uniref:Phosphoribosylformylglycinamidine cyclo-ligase n=1 Tax=Candidatus Fimadaptatus faecigallinarum TaxID=2840814 RepID=A0A9D1S503_9FIRM|nr:phosphoribosylformylglycinamidine cyclo-ligase [Candidatus Fimadaptatus faecigallinarum]
MITYKDSGVDVERGYEAVRLMKEHVKRTFNDNVIGDLGSFGGFYSIENNGMSKPVLVAGTDGVGTKLKLAFLTGRHDTVGIDCVAMCVNDVVCQGAMPLFFLDYLATGNLKPELAATVVRGVAEGCLQAGCALIGGETAEMPGFYPEGEYDLAGFCVGMVDKAQAINGSGIRAGDTLVGLASSGVHSNGFSLIRRLLVNESTDLSAVNPELGCSLADELLRPTRIYVRTIKELISRFTIKGIAHITGGGFIENIPRILPDGLTARIDRGSWPVQPIFTMMQRISGMKDEQIYNTFNMGIGMVLAVDSEEVDAVVCAANSLGEKAFVIGEVIESADGGKGVKLA